MDDSTRPGAVVTGAANTVGAPTARLLVGRGRLVVELDRDEAGLAAVADDLEDRFTAEAGDISPLITID